MTEAQVLALAKLMMQKYVDSIPKRIEKAARKREKKVRERKILHGMKLAGRGSPTRRTYVRNQAAKRSGR